MPNLFLIDGASGSGKSDLIQYCNEIDNSSTFIKKYTNKPADIDGVKRKDLQYLTKEEYADTFDDNYQNNYEYNYPKGSTIKYLILKSEIDDALMKHTNVFLIVRDIKVIKKIKSDYSKYININIVTLFLYCDSHETRKRIAEQCKNENDCVDEAEIEEKIKKRIERDSFYIKDYTDNIGSKLYDHVILNVENRDQFHACIKNLVDSYQYFDKKFLSYKAFIIMPYTQGWEWTHFNEVKKAIMKGAERQGFIAERQDDKDCGSQEFVKGIKDSIKEALVCVGDLTLARPNCYYEIGLAEEHHSLDAIILIKDDTIRDSESIHSDMRGRTAEPYTFNRGNFEDIANIVSKKLAVFKKNHLFITDIMKKQNSKL